jgi:GT2 family glycosyltransferase
VDFDSVGGYSENMKEGLEDWDFWINLLKYGGKVKYINGVHFFYRIKKKKYSRNTSIDDNEYISLRRQIWENHKDIFATVFLNPLETSEYLRVANSKEYLIGRILLNPIRKIFKR